MRSTDEVYGSLAYDGAPLLRVALCVSRAFLVTSVQESVQPGPVNCDGGESGEPQIQQLPSSESDQGETLDSSLLSQNANCSTVGTSFENDLQTSSTSVCVNRNEDYSTSGIGILSDVQSTLAESNYRYVSTCIKSNGNSSTIAASLVQPSSTDSVYASTKTSSSTVNTVKVSNKGKCDNYA